MIGARSKGADAMTQTDRPENPKDAAAGAESTDASGRVSGQAARAESGTTLPARPLPAESPVIAHTPARPGEAAPPAAPAMPIESTLLGEASDSPAMRPRPQGDAQGDKPAPLKLGQAVAAAGSSQTPAPQSPLSPPTAARSAGKAVEQPADKAPLKPADQTTGKAETVTTTPASSGAVPPAVATSAPAQTAPAPVVRRVGFWPLVAGGVVAAALGSAATFYALPHLPSGWLPQAQTPAAPEVDTEALKAAILADLPRPAAPAPDEAAIRAAVEAALADARPDLDAAVDTAARAAATDEAQRILSEAAPAPGEAPSADATALAAQAERLDAIEARLTELAAAVAATPAPAINSPSTVPLATGALDDLRAELAALKTEVAALAARPEADPQAMQDARTAVQHAEQAAQSLGARVDDVAGELAALTGRMDAAESHLSGVAALMHMGEALRDGDEQARGDAAAALDAAGMGDAASLAREAPALSQLQTDFAPAARAALAAARRGEAHSGLSGIGAFFAEQTGARSLTPREGDDPDAVLSRMGGHVEAGAIADALTEAEALPDTAREAMTDWLAAATRWVAAQDALGQITTAPSQ